MTNRPKLSASRLDPFDINESALMSTINFRRVQVMALTYLPDAWARATIGSLLAMLQAEIRNVATQSTPAPNLALNS